MTETKDNSSLPLLLSITGAILAVAIGGWFALNRQTPAADEGTDVPVAAPMADTVPIVEAAPSEYAEGAVENEPGTGATIGRDQGALVNIDAELRKARLAANADILVLPPLQSALYYYGRVLDADPRHEIAIAELDVILSKVAQTVTQHLAANELDAAYEIAVLVAKQRPEHALVDETQQTLDEYTEQLVEQAIQHAQKGQDDQADQLVATAADLPGRNPNYIKAIRDSIDEIRGVRQSAERDRQQRAQLAQNEARAAWVDRIQASIAQGNLISPAGASARDLLAESNQWATERAQLTTEVASAMLDTAQFHIDAQQLEDAETLLSAAQELGGDPDRHENLLAALEAAFIAAESQRIAQMSELVRLRNTPPRYPKRAQDRNQSGWVDVYFTITESGETADIAVDNSEPKSVFDRAAMDAVEQWLFQPVEYRGQVISQRAAARLVFVME